MTIEGYGGCIIWVFDHVTTKSTTFIFYFFFRNPAN